MHNQQTDQEIIERLRDRVAILRDGLRAVRTMLVDALVAPPWPKREMIGFLRFMAEEADLPQKCASPRCRRAGRCFAVRVDAKNPPCGPMWTDEDWSRLRYAMLGIVAAWGALCARTVGARKTLGLPPLVEDEPEDAGPSDEPRARRRDAGS